MAFRVCCSCGDPYDVTCKRVIYDGQPLNSDTTMSGYDREWLSAEDVLEDFDERNQVFWVGCTRPEDYESNSSSSVFLYATKHKPFRYKIGTMETAFPDAYNVADHRRDVGPPVRASRHFNNAEATNVLFNSPMRSGIHVPIGTTQGYYGFVFGYRAALSTYDYCRLVINGVASTVVDATGTFSSQSNFTGTGSDLTLWCPSDITASLPLLEKWDFTNAEVYLDLWITTRIAIVDNFDYVGLTEDPGYYASIDEYGVRTALGHYGQQWISTRLLVGPSKFKKHKYEVSFDRNGVGGESTVILGQRNDPIIEAVSNWRPGAYEGGAVFAPATAHWFNIDEPISPPDAGDGVYVTKSGAAAQSQGYIGSSPGAFYGVLTGAAVKVLAHCDNADGDCRITGYYTTVNNNTNSVTGISENLTTSPAWYTFPRLTTIPNTTVPMINTPRFGITITGTDGTSKAYIDAIYLELQYNERPEWEYTRTGSEGKQRLTHNPSGDYIEMQFGEELVKIIVNKGATSLSGYHKDCLYMKNTEVFYDRFEGLIDDMSGEWPFELFADAWDADTEAEFGLISRRLTSPNSSYRFTPGGINSQPVIPGLAGGSYDKDTGVVFVDFPRIVTIRKL